MNQLIRILCLITIVARGRAEDVTGILAEHHIGVQHIAQGRGTASSDIKHYLGLGSPEKDIIISLALHSQIAEALPALTSRLQMAKAGHGISFTIPLSSISLDTSRRVTALKSTQPEKEDLSMPQEITHDLIIAIVDNDASDIAFDAAKEAGCRGGTILKARQVRSEEVRKIFGITIQPEKEIVMTLVPRADKQKILKAICNKILQETGEHGLAFSLPVADVIGLTNLDLMKDVKE